MLQPVLASAATLLLLLGIVLCASAASSLGWFKRKKRYTHIDLTRCYEDGYFDGFDNFTESFGFKDDCTCDFCQVVKAIKESK